MTPEAPEGEIGKAQMLKRSMNLPCLISQEIIKTPKVAMRAVTEVQTPLEDRIRPLATHHRGLIPVRLADPRTQRSRIRST